MITTGSVCERRFIGTLAPRRFPGWWAALILAVCLGRSPAQEEESDAPTPFRSSYPGGQKKEEGWNVGAERVGQWTTWHENGRLRSSGPYAKGRKHGAWTEHSIFGRPIRHEWYENGQLARAQDRGTDVPRTMADLRALVRDGTTLGQRLDECLASPGRDGSELLPFGEEAAAVMADALARADMKTALRLLELIGRQGKAARHEAAAVAALAGRPQLAAAARKTLANISSGLEPEWRPHLELTQGRDPDRQRGLDALAAMGPLAVATLPELEALLAQEHPYLRQSTARTCLAIRQPLRTEVPGILDALRSPVRDERVRAAALVYALGPETRAAASLLPFLADGDPLVAWWAAHAVLTQRGDSPELVAALVQLLAHHDTGVRQEAAARLLRTGHAAATTGCYLAMLGSTGYGLSHVIWWLELPGHDPAVVVPRLVETFLDPARAPFVAAGLGRIGRGDPRVQALLLRALEHGDGETVAAVIEGLLGHGPVTDDFAAAFVALLESASARVRAVALRSVERVVTDPRARLYFVRRALSDPSPDVRRSALTAVPTIGPGSEVLAPRIVAMFRTDADVVRPAALDALAHVGARSPDAVGALLENPFAPASIGRSVAQVLQRILLVQSESVPELRAWIESPDARVQSMGLQVAKELGPCARPLSASITVLAQLSASHEARTALHQIDRDAWVALEVGDYLKAAAGEAGRIVRRPPQSHRIRWGPAAVPLLVRALASPNPRVAGAACVALADFGALARGAVPELVRLLNEGPAELKEQAVRALAQIGGKESVPVFARLLRSPDRASRIRGLTGFELLRQDYAHLVPEILARIGDPEESARAFAAVKALGKEAHAAVPWLLSAFEDPPRYVAKDRAAVVRSMALDLLAGIGPGAKAAVPRLLPLAETGDAAALAALIRIGPGDARLAELVHRHLCSPDPGLALAAARGLATLGAARFPPVATFQQALRTGNAESQCALLAALSHSPATVRSLAADLAAIATNQSPDHACQPAYHALRLLAGAAPEALAGVAFVCSAHALAAITQALENAPEVPAGLVRVLEQRARDAAPDEVDLFLYALAAVSPGHDLVVDRLRLRRLWRDRLQRPADLPIRVDRVRPENVLSLAAILLELDRADEPARRPSPPSTDTRLDVVAKMGAPIVPLLLALAGHPDPRARRQSAVLLGRVGQRTPEAFASVRLALRDRDEHVRAAAFVALPDVATDGEEAARAVLADGHDWYGLHPPAIACLTRMGPAARLALPALRHAIAAGITDALRAFAAVGGRDAEAVAELVEAAERGPRTVRSTALWALGDVGPLATPPVPLLVSSLMDRDDAVQQAAFHALGRMGPAAGAARETVAWFAWHGAIHWREVAEETLRGLDRSAAMGR